jgi:DinB superfamily
MTGTIDPVSDPQAYQRMILGVLGDRDPYQVQMATPQRLSDLVSESGDALRRRPAEHEWSVLQLIGHLSDGEIVNTARYRWIIAEDTPPLPGYDQDLWVSALHDDDDPETLLLLFSTLRSANLRLWRSAKEEQRQRVGMHSERGPESFELLFKLIAGHDLFHIEQMRRTLAAVRGGGAA